TAPSDSGDALRRFWQSRPAGRSYNPQHRQTRLCSEGAPTAAMVRHLAPCLARDTAGAETDLRPPSDSATGHGSSRLARHPAPSRSANHYSLTWNRSLHRDTDGLAHHQCHSPAYEGRYASAHLRRAEMRTRRRADPPTLGEAHLPVPDW